MSWENFPTKKTPAEAGAEFQQIKLLNSLAVQVHQERLQGVFDGITEVSRTQATAFDNFLTLVEANYRKTIFNRERYTQAFFKNLFKQVAHYETPFWVSRAKYPCPLKLGFFSTKNKRKSNEKFFFHKKGLLGCYIVQYA